MLFINVSQPFVEQTNCNIQPYITKTYFGLQKPPVNLAKIAIGDGAIGSFVEFEQLPTVGSLLRSRYYY